MLFSYPDAVIGRVAGAYVGYKNTAELTVSVRVVRANGMRETVDHEIIENPVVLSISAGVWNRQHTDMLTFGQAKDALDNMVSYAEGWDAKKVARFREIWDEWHVNDMSAACVHQSKDNHETCEMGYRWGSQWLVRPLPIAIIDELRQMMEVGKLANVW